ncbi:MAG: dihydropteroate synthase [Bacteroidales bacterium]|nr:dihydropteroate synthase [Bacteroidales bacterium]
MNTKKLIVKDTDFSYISNNKIIRFNRPLVMGILNVTSDSFYDGGKYNTEKAQIEHSKIMIEQGADIIDIGAMSTRPGAINFTEEEEIKRIEPVIKTLIKHFPDAVFSVDTFRSKVAKMSAENGIHIINDISGGTIDKNMFKTISKLNIPYVMMHIQGTPQNMQKNPVYNNVVEDIYNYFSKKIAELNNLGFNKIILDPGFGFGKTVQHNYKLLKELKYFKKLNLPILVGISRKSMINKVLGTTPAEALNGTTVLNTIALMNGANILRVHDVKEAKEAVKIIKLLN